VSLPEELKKSVGALIRESLAGTDVKEVCEPVDVLGKKRASRPSTFNSKNRSSSSAWTHPKKVSQ
jgi:hypothetical protein